MLAWALSSLTNIVFTQVTLFANTTINVLCHIQGRRDVLSVRGPHLMTSVSCMTSPNDLSLMHDQKEPVVIYCAEIHNPDHAFAHTMSFQDDVRVLCHNALPATCQQEGQILLPLSSDQTPAKHTITKCDKSQWICHKHTQKGCHNT